jgi:AcrR family transcriptional regulator
VTGVEDRRRELKAALIAAADRAISGHGLAGIKARELAKEANCAVGAIYNVFPDLDALIFEVNARTLALFEQFVAKVEVSPPRAKAAGSEAVGKLVRLATAYLDFAAANHARGRALFDHRVEKPDGEAIPDWYVAEQARMFGLVEGPLRELRPDMGDEAVRLFARTMFSGVHGVVNLGLDAKLLALPPDVLRGQVELLVRALADGLLAERPERRKR